MVYRRIFLTVDQEGLVGKRAAHAVGTPARRSGAEFFVVGPAIASHPPDETAALGEVCERPALWGCGPRRVSLSRFARS